MKPSLLIGKNTHQEILEKFLINKKITISGASNETAKALLLAHFLSLNPNSSVLVTDTEANQEGLIHWLHFFGQESTKLPRIPPKEDPQFRFALQQFLQMYEIPTCTTLTQETWNSSFPLYANLHKRAMVIAVGDNQPFTAFVEQLITIGYEYSVDSTLLPGQYRRQGDTLDVYPVQLHTPVRIIFHFDTIEGIQYQADGKKQKNLTIFPMSIEKETALADQFPKGHILILDDLDDIPNSENSPTLRFSAFPEHPEHHAHLRYLSILKFYTLTDFLNDVHDKLHHNWRLLVVSRRMQELRGVLKEEHIPFTEDDEAQEGKIILVECVEDDILPHSIQNPDLQCALLTDREIFTLRKVSKQRSVAKLALDFLTSLSSGDYVVHMEHGIGVFQGVTQKLVDETLREYLELHYAEGDKLFVPVDQVDKLSKFVHEEGQEPVLTRLGTAEWKRVTERIEKETEEIAKGLLELYAKRAAAKGFAYSGNGAAMKKFTEAFPYQETPGQQKAIEEIMEDMEDDHPMDRLVCGDVGFGKTEVAMRAAFKATQDGKQVAVLSPITILADQHYHTFKERMKGFPVRIEMLSRFRSQKEQQSILEKLRKGEIDIIIGTHRLLQPDLKFLNLGLVIVDEEQRFGVKQKERFKEMRASVDLLTLTATPIPRTLNLGLHKLRDISTITTPPPGRLPIITEVRKYSDQLVRQAILTEFKRKGQCFVLHNRVETIDAFCEKLRSLVPEVTFIVAHGQLNPDSLEERILAFKEGKYDVLVSSTIIENGIDLPRANTLIVNEAERFGLSQLYQLRGRVGRSKLQAYAYFLYHSQKLHDDAKKRLRAIVEACELGSGFQVAMRDLEIRGAGEVLGVSQSGTMQTVGISHYLRMLKSAVEELKAGKKEGFEEVENVEILLPIEALIPAFYIPDSEEKISVYQKLAGSEEEAILEEFEADLKAEYGPFPVQVQNLFHVLQLKLVCRRAGVFRVKAEEKGKEREIVLSLSSSVTAHEIMQLVSHRPQWRISGNVLRIHENNLVQDEQKQDWLTVLHSDITLLQRKKKRK